MTESMLTTIKGKLVVSCQALEQEPLHGASIMARMALAAQQGGAAAVRANGLADVVAIQQQVALPVIAIIKRDYPDSEVFITATEREVDELMAARPPMIAMDATDKPRSAGGSLARQVAYCRRQYPDLLLMADIASVAQARQAEQLGFDVIGMTLYCYTEESRGRMLAEQDFAFLREVLAAVSRPVIAEGNVLTPEMAARCLALGCHAVWWAGLLPVRSR
ncbi:Putative N-acetylmannosamine-6-phosphate 2-epimerase [Sodalis glossinidius str. 'morsitans']|uniref:N-acylglucosamine-6-phosphate 2-epimerase n=1 Tax=Sodalis glossinidius (strain morsitans) TaxID=343509 RepID=Q2NRN8_SODGM|nr:putative N-acetylmannosamine-6-phosphate epimerase [Sodalis glossinidius str. 'morsitans']CRL46167.1 Putative N-acetylmannosamine-6-phosphate 2-epimerase [Sodalis glossinidius str. 'morsitans']